MDDEQKKFYIKSLGVEILLRTFSIDDYLKFNEINQSSLSEKDKVKRVLHSHIISPSLDYEVFAEISDSDLEALGQEFLNYNFDSELSVNENDDFYNYFLLVINNHQKKFTESVHKDVEPLLKANQEFIDNIRRSIEPILKSSIYPIQPQIKRISESLSNISRSIILPYLDVHDSVVNISNLISSINQELIESFQHQLKSMVNWFDTHDEIFDSFRQYWRLFEKQYGITEERAIEILRKYHWFISPCLPTSLLYDVVRIDEEFENNKRAEINHLFINYFEENNWFNLNVMIADWKDIPLFKGRRFKIIADCVEVVKLCDSSHVNAANVVIPTLISQIDGIISDYLEMNGLAQVKKRWVDKKTSEYKSRNDFIKEIKPQVMPSSLDALATITLLEILFQRVYRGEVPDIQFYFIRNKIVHGEKTHYGRRDYMIRAFLILDFLAHIIQQTSFQDS